MTSKSTNLGFVRTDVTSVPSRMRTSGYRTLLVPLDGSLLAEHALPHALAIARRTGASIRLVYVHAPADPTDEPWRLYSTHHLDLNRYQVRQKQEYLKDVVRRIGQRDSVEIITFLSESKRTVDQLSALARGVDLVVMASYGRGWWGRLWHGSTADALLSKLACPLLLVRGYQSPVDLTGDPVARKVLVPLDGSKQAEQILMPAMTISLVDDAAVTLLHVDDCGRTKSRIASSDMPGYLNQMADNFKNHLTKVSSRVLRTGSRTAQAVLAFATAYQVDLVALTDHASGRWGHFIQDRIADVVLQRAGMKVLLLRSDDRLNKGIMT